MRASEFAAIEFVAAEQARAVLDCVAAHRVVLVEHRLPRLRPVRPRHHRGRARPAGDQRAVTGVAQVM